MSTNRARDLADEVAEMGRERHQVDVDREQDELDRHQDDDDVLAVDEDAEDAEREQDRGDDEIMAEPDDHGPDPLPRTHLADLHRGRLGAGDLLGDVLPSHIRACGAR